LEVSPKSMSEVAPVPLPDPIPATPRPVTPAAESKTPMPQKEITPPPQTPLPETAGTRPSPQNKIRAKAVDLVRSHFPQNIRRQELRIIHLTFF
jgi:hypothetical protein